MPIENRNLEPGTKLTARYKKQEYTAEVVTGEKGKMRWTRKTGQVAKRESRS